MKDNVTENLEERNVNKLKKDSLLLPDIKNIPNFRGDKASAYRCLYVHLF